MAVKKKLLVEVCKPFSRICCKAHKTDAGYDLFACENKLLWGNRPTLVHTGIKIKLPEGTVGDIRPRSGNSARGIKVAYGTVDSGYTGELLVNMSALWHKVHRGDRIAQLVVLPLAPVELTESNVDGVITDRGCNGFGSTGK